MLEVTAPPAGPGQGRAGGSSTLGAAWALWALALVGLATVPWFDHLTCRAGRPDLVQLNASTVPYLLAIGVAATVGAVLAGRLPRHPVGWLALTVGPGLVIPPYQSAVDPVAIPALAGAVLVTIVVGFVVIVAGLVVGAGSLVARFRHARGVERQQLRWLALAAALTGVAAAVVGVGMAVGATAVPLFAAGVCLALLPLATGAAILRYRLYDLDRIISRTLAYGLLTVLLGGGYALVVLGLGQLIGRDSSLVVAAATLAVAAAFQPARRRVQAAVDRRFNRRRYDAAQTIAAFGDRLRQQVDLDTLRAELVAVVGQTMQPTSVSLWLRPSRSPEVPASTGTG
jgi:hypothetical protein